MARKNRGSTIQKPFPLLKLPPEIRNRIWKYTLVKDGEVEIRPFKPPCLMKRMVRSRLRSGKELKSHGIDDEQRFNTTSLALTFASHQLYQEATFIYYSKNTFAFDNSWYPYLLHQVFEHFVEAIGPQNARCITAVHFYTTDPTFIRYLCFLPGLKQLTYTAPLLSFLSGSHQIRWSDEMSFYAKKHRAVIIKQAEQPIELLD